MAARKKPAINFEEDSKVEPTNAQLSELSKLITYQIRLEDGVAALQLKLKEAQTKLDKIKLAAIPGMMQELGYDLLKTRAGHTVEVDKGISASITKANQTKAFAWLRKTKNASLIKNAIQIVYTGKDEKKFMAAIKVLDKAELPYGVNQSVHAGTLKAFVKEELAQGRQVDNSITIFEYGIAKISRKPS